MANQQYVFEIGVEISKVRAAVGSFAKETQKQLDGINFNTSVSAIRDGFAIINATAGAAFREISRFASDAVDEASKAEDAFIGMANALRLAGDFSQDAVSGFEDLASQIQKTTKFSDEQVFSSVAIAKQYRLTNIEAEKAIKVAADLAAVTGVDLTTATEQVSRSFNGFIDKGLARSFPALKALSQEALLSGGALDVLRQRLDGSAEALGATFSGRVIQAKNAFSDLQESIGNLIINNPVVIEAINQIGVGFSAAAKEISANKESIIALVNDGVLFLLKSIPLLLKGLNSLFKVFVSINAIANKLGATLAFLPQIIQFSGPKASQVYQDLSDTLEEINVNAGESANSLDDLFVPLIDQADKLSKAVQNVNKSQKSLNKTFGQQGPSVTGIAPRTEDATSEKDLKKQAEDQRKRIEDIARDPINQLVKLSIEKQKIDKTDIAAAGAGFTAIVLKGAAGAQKAVSAAAGAAASAVFGPAFGPVVSEIVDVLGQGPEKVKEMVRGFAEALPQIVQNIAEAFPVLIEELAKTLPPALAKTMPKVAITFSLELIKNIPNIVKGFAQGLVDAAKQFVAEIFNAIKGAVGFGGGENSIGGSSLIGGGLGAAFGQAIAGSVGAVIGGARAVANVLGIGGEDEEGKRKKVFGIFAEGGRVPDDREFNNDGFPARLDRGEQVFSRDLTTRLENFLNGQGAEQNLTVNLVVGESQLASAILNLNRRGFRTA